MSNFLHSTTHKIRKEYNTFLETSNIDVVKNNHDSNFYEKKLNLNSISRRAGTFIL